MEGAVLAAVSEDFSKAQERSTNGASVGLEQRLVSLILWLVRSLPNGSLRARALFSLVRLPSVSQVEVQYLLDQVPLTVNVKCGQSKHRLDLNESIFHFNSMVGWHLGLHRQDIEREPVHISFGKLHVVRQSVPGCFEGFLLARQRS